MGGKQSFAAIASLHGSFDGSGHSRDVTCKLSEGMQKGVTDIGA
jgi:hypothetical protein